MMFGLLVRLMFTFFIPLICGCNDSVFIEDPPETAEITESGSFHVDNQSVLMITNHFGPVILDGSFAHPTIDWSFLKRLHAENIDTARTYLDNIAHQISSNDDTIFIHIDAPEPTDVRYASVRTSLTLPSHLFCRIHSESGPVISNYLDSTLIVDSRRSNVTIQEQYGSCRVSIITGLVEMEVFPDPGEEISVIADSADVRLYLPRRSPVYLYTSVVQGNVSLSDFSLDTYQIQTPSQVVGQSGDASIQVDLSVNTGSITILGQ